jgi:hypothetical protein
MSPRPSIPSTYSQTGQQGQSLQQPKGQGQIYQDQPGVPAQTQGYRFQQPNVSQQNQPSGQQNYQYQQQGQIQNQGLKLVVGVVLTSSGSEAVV